MNIISQTIPLQDDTIFSPFKAKEFDIALEYLSNNGFTGVELAISYPNKVNTDKLLNKLQAHHLSATTISTGQIYSLEGWFLSSEDNTMRDKAISHIKGHVDLATQLGFPKVTIGLIRGKLESDPFPNLLANFRSSIMECVDYAYKRRVILQIEPICKAETILINTTDEALSFLNELGNPEYLGILFDTYHSHIEDRDMVKAIKAASGKITNVHFADSNRGLPGTGTIDFSMVYKAISDTGYQGPYALETLSIPDNKYVLDNCANSIMNIIKSF